MCSATALARRPRVLIVDDDPLSLRATSRVLKAAGWDVDTTVDAPSIADANRYDVVLTDWQPLGPETLSACHDAGTPVVVFTGSPDRAPAGVAVLAKPVNSIELDATLSAAAGVVL